MPRSDAVADLGRAVARYAGYGINPTVLPILHIATLCNDPDSVAVRPQPQPQAQASTMNKATQAELAARILRQLYPNPRPHLNAASPWQLLVATILSAQCTDARVNTVTPALFARWPGPEETAQAGLDELEDAIRSTGFFRMKARNILQTARRIMEVYGGDVPRSLAELVTLPGVARKTANVTLWGAFGVNEGLAVDTHVARISFRLGLTDAQDADKIEQDLLVLFPRAEWGDVNHRMVSFGRDICRARAPRCDECELLAVCPRRGVDKARKIR